MRSIGQLTLKENERKALQKLKEKLHQKFPDAEIILYGSKARGDYDEESDIDLLILVKSSVNRELKEELTEIIYELELKYDVIFGTIIENKKFWESPLANAMPLHWNIDREGIYIQKQEIIDLAKYRLEKAKNTLSDARRCFLSATLESTVNRIYYAMFYAVNALLITKGLSSSRHSGVRAFFNREFVNKGLIEIRLGKFYSDMYVNRQEGDYKDFVKFEKEDVELWLNKAEEFINKIEELTLKIIDNEEKG